MRRAGSRGWLLDTNVVSELRKGARCHPRVLAWAETVPPAACFVSRVTLAELRFGIERVTDPGFRAELEGWLRDGVRAWFGGRILESDEAVLLRWRRLVWEGQKANYTYAQPDALIAATALEHELGVVTRNAADRARASDCSILGAARPRRLRVASAVPACLRPTPPVRRDPRGQAPGPAPRSPA